MELKAKEVPCHIKAKLPGNVCILELINNTKTRKGKYDAQRHRLITRLSITSQDFLLTRQRLIIENEWYCVCDTRVCDYSHR